MTHLVRAHPAILEQLFKLFGWCPVVIKCKRDSSFLGAGQHLPMSGRIERSDPPIEAADFALSCRYLIQQLRHHPRFPPPQQILDLHRLRWEEGREMAMGWDHG
jgi:hypothetical protein